MWLINRRKTITELHRISLPAMATSVCASTDGYIFVEMRANWDRDSQMQLACFDFTGQQKWQHDFTSQSSCEVRAANQSVWISNGKQIYQLDTDGMVVQVIPVPLADSEYIGNYLVIPDGFYICTRSRGQNTEVPRILRMANMGQLIWSTTLVKPPRNSTNWQPDYGQPLLATHNRLLSTYYDYSSGVAVSYCLDAITGELQWTTPKRPTGNISLGPHDTFLIGSQGYGKFSSWLYDENGQVLQHWQSQGYVVISEQNEIHVVEMENASPSRMSFSTLEASGQVRKGPHLRGYYTAHPSIDKKGTVIFWQGGELLTVDTRMNLKSLYSASTDKLHPSISSRTLLLQPNTLAFTISQGGTHELWIFNTPLDSLAASNWPCEGGNLGNNPVYAST